MPTFEARIPVADLDDLKFELDRDDPPRSNFRRLDWEVVSLPGEDRVTNGRLTAARLRALMEGDDIVITFDADDPGDLLYVMRGQWRRRDGNDCPVAQVATYPAVRLPLQKSGRITGADDQNRFWFTVEDC